MIGENLSDRRNQIYENDEYISPDDIEFLKVGTLGSKREIYNIEIESDERNQVNIVDDKESDEGYQIG